MELKLDQASVAQRYQDILDLFLQVNGSNSWSPDDINALLERPNVGCAWVESHKIVGLMIAHQSIINPQIVPNKILLLRRLVVDKNYQMAGIASQLLTSLCDKLPSFTKSTGIHTIGWQIGHGNHTSRAFFDHLGFSPKGRIEVDNAVDDIYLEEFDYFKDVLSERRE